jgi:hypothetical protein
MTSMSLSASDLPQQLDASVDVILPRFVSGRITLVHLDPAFYTFEVNGAIVYTGPVASVLYQVAHYALHGRAGPDRRPPPPWNTAIPVGFPPPAGGHAVHREAAIR